jgi:16S rRNA processing protein RimM
MKKEELIKLAFVAHPHGLRGEAEIRLLNNKTNESVLEEGMKVYLYPSGEKSRLSPYGEEWTISKLRFGNKVIATFDGVKDRTDLESMIPFEIFLDRDSFPEPDEDEVYLVDLVNLPVVNEAGEKIGVLESFSDNGMQYLFDVRMDTGEIVTLPYVEAFFPEINLEEKKIVMVLPDYTE